jgi:hypothetical protein
MSHHHHYGNKRMKLYVYSIIMEYADNGDVFQKICEHQSTGAFIKEKVIWKILI